jgi:serine/threonine-protein kinase
MPTVSLNDLVETIRQHRLVKPVHLDELSKLVADRSLEPQALIKELHRRGWLTVFQCKQLLLGHGANLVLGPYLLLELLGEGGNGRVFKARHLNMERVVALKLLRKDLLLDNEAVGRFYREVEVISQLSHPAIVHAYDAGVVGAVHFLALEYVQGIDLDRMVKESGRLQVPQACDYIRQAALGLQYAHERGLVHRDIKPSNLLVSGAASSGSSPGVPKEGSSSGEWSINQILGPTPWGIVKILDLGLARLRQPVAGSRTSHLTVIAGKGVMQGTPDYLAPEQAMDFHRADIRADIYSLGCTFYFLLAAQPPFGSGSLSQKLIRHQQAEAPPIEKQREGLPAELPRIIQRMLAKRPDDRYPTPGEVALALAPFCVSPGGSTSFRAESTMTLNCETTPASGIQAAPFEGSSFAQNVENPRAGSFLAPSLSRFRPPLSRRLLLTGGVGVGLFLLFLAVMLLATSGGDPAKVGGAPTSAAIATGPAMRTVLSFNGNNTLIPLPENVFRSSQTLTLEAWFKTTTGGVIVGYQATIYPKPPGSYVPVLFVGVGDGLLGGQFWNGGTNPIRSQVRVNDDRWHHVALVANDATKTQTLYLDGNPSGTLAGPLVHLDMIHSQIGIGNAWGQVGKGGWAGFAGNIAEVRVWHVARSHDEIQQNREKPLAGTEAGLVAYYPLDDILGDTARDRSPQGRKMEFGAGVPAQKPTRSVMQSFMR